MTVGMLADCETFAGHIDAARADWKAALAHLETLAQTLPGARLDWAFGLQGYAQLELQFGHFEAAVAAIDQALALVAGTPTTHDEPQQTAYRAWVLTQVGALREAQHRPAEARLYYQQAATLFTSLAQRKQLQAGWRPPIEQLRARGAWVEQP